MQLNHISELAHLPVPPVFIYARILESGLICIKVLGSLSDSISFS